ncbi:MAG: NAD(P)/FAD-dependent oxidoreductase [Deferrisomatales bacterium]
MSGSKAGRRLVFVGGGHAHLYSLKRAADLVGQGAEVVLVAPQRYHYYSGMGPGFLSRIYRPKQVRVDVRSLAVSRGCTFVEDRVVSVDPGARLLLLESGRALPYDAVSFNTGSRVPAERIPGAAEEATPVKPVENLDRVRERVLDSGRGRPCRVLVLGGGPAGVEVAANLWRLGRTEGVPAEVTVCEAAPRLLPGLPPRAGELARRSLEGRGIAVRTGLAAAGLEAGVASFEGGDSFAYDVAVLTVGIVPHELYRDSGLPTGADGGLLVDEFLRSPQYPEVFGGGDCVCFSPRELPRVGVYAVRQGPVLFRNLRACLGAGAAVPFRPQRRFLLILNLADGTGLAVWGRWAARGRWAFRWKDYLDRSFMGRFQVSGELSGPEEEAP